jgi:hypothetical protein
MNTLPWVEETVKQIPFEEAADLPTPRLLAYYKKFRVYAEICWDSGWTETCACLTCRGLGGEMCARVFRAALREVLRTREHVSKRGDRCRRGRRCRKDKR